MNDLIEKYILGKLSGKEKQKVEERLKSDASFRAEYEFQKELRESILEDDVMHLRETLKDLSAGRASDRRFKSGSQKMRYIAAAASFLILLGIGGWFLFFQSHANPAELYEKHYQPYDNVYSVRSLDIKFNKDSLVRKAFVAYDNEEWRKAETAMDLLTEESTKNVSFIFYGGIIKLERKKYDQAHRHFQKVIDSGRNLFTEQAYWYAGLSCLKTGNTEKAKEYFVQIAEKGMAREKEVRDILESL